MKSKLILLVLLTSLVFNVSANDVQDAKSAVSSAQRKTSQLASQKKSLNEKVAKWNADLQEAKAKVESLQEKQKSPAYKSATKKVDDLDGKIKNAEIEIQQIDKSIDSLSNVILRNQQIVTAAETQKAREQEEKRIAKEEKAAAKRQERAEQSVTVVHHEEETESYETQESVSYATSSSEETSAKSDEPTSSKSSKSSGGSKFWKFCKTTFWIIIGLIVLKFCWKIVVHGGGGGSSSSRSSSRSSNSNNSAAKAARDADKGWIDKYKAEIAQLKANIRREKANMTPTNRKAKMMHIEGYQRSIAELEGRIAHIKRKNYT